MSIVQKVYGKLWLDSSILVAFTATCNQQRVSDGTERITFHQFDAMQPPNVSTNLDLVEKIINFARFLKNAGESDGIFIKIYTNAYLFISHGTVVVVCFTGLMWIATEAGKSIKSCGEHGCNKQTCSRQHHVAQAQARVQQAQCPNTNPRYHTFGWLCCWW